jgi:N-acetylglucosamine-6-phosphate deacetylase
MFIRHRPWLTIGAVNEGQISARHYRTRQPVSVRWRDGRITSIETTPDAPENLWIAPTLFDVQVNGYGGIDFQQDNLSVEQLLSASRQLQRDGCAQFLLTLITDDWARLIARLRKIKQLRDSHPELASAIAGWHIEGPFLSDQPGFHGAHNPALMCDPTSRHMQELRDAAGEDPLLLTLAPERTGAIEAIRVAKPLGITVSLGHTNASAEVLKEAVNAGATVFTHLGNGCPRELDRHDNILLRVFDTPGLTVGIIPDSIHVSPAPFRLFDRVLTSVYYTTDAMAAAGAPPGRYNIGSLEVEVGADQIVRQPGKTNFAGSALKPIDGIFRAAKMLDRDWQQVWPLFSEEPATMMAMTNALRVGAPATFCVLEVEGDRLLSLNTYRSGLEG